MPIKVLFIGEARDRREHMFDHGFVGSSGAELARMLQASGLIAEGPPKSPSELEMIRFWKRLREHEGIDIANVFNDHPEDNKIELFFTNAASGVPGLPPLKAGKYLRPDFAFHVHALWDKIENLAPNLIVALGNTACWAVLGESKITALRGTIKESPRFGCKVLPTYHPAAVLRQWNLRTIVITDLSKAARECEFGEMRRIERFVTVYPTLEEIAEWASRPANYYAVDIETLPGNVAPTIEMIGFARAHNDALVIPFYDAERGGNYWPSADAELCALRLVDQILCAPVPKIFQNGIFDLSHILRMGLRPIMCGGDTMLLHHSLYPEMLKGLGFLGSIYSNEIAWKTMRGKGDNLKRDE